MFTIEHDFDATVITLIDEGSQPLAQDVIVEAYEDAFHSVRNPDATLHRCE